MKDEWYCPKKKPLLSLVVTWRRECPQAPPLISFLSFSLPGMVMVEAEKKSHWKPLGWANKETKCTLLESFGDTITNSFTESH